MQGQGCRQTSTHGPKWGEHFFPVLKPHPTPQPCRLLSPPFLRAGQKPQHCVDALGRRASWEVLEYGTSLARSVPLVEMDFVQTKGIR